MQIGAIFVPPFFDPSHLLKKAQEREVEIPGESARESHKRAVRATTKQTRRFRMAEWQYQIHRMELLHDADLDDQIGEVLKDYGMKGWELVQVLHRQQVPEDPVYRLIFKTEKPVEGW